MTEVNYPYVVLVGLAGSGKSEIAKKLAHPEFVSSNCWDSLNQTSDLFWTFDGTMVVCDVPEDLHESEIFYGNIPLSLALTFEPISQILITVKADDDINTVVENIRLYSETLLRLTNNDNQIVGVLINGLNKISSWHPNELRWLAEKELKLEHFIFSNSLSTDIVEEIHNISDSKLSIPISKLADFDIIDVSFTGLRSSINWQVNRIVENFRHIKRQFQSTHAVFNDYKSDNADIMFEFQAWMKDRTTFACERLKNSKKITFYYDENDEDLLDQYMISMENQIRHILFDLKMITKSFLVERDVDPRRCPYCSEIWIKDVIQGCDGFTTCGNKQSRSDFREFEFERLGNYAFRWTPGSGLFIVPSDEVLLSENYRTRPTGFGCGRSLTWNEMPQVDLPKELLTVVSAVSVVPSIEPKEKQSVSKTPIVPPNMIKSIPATSKRGDNYVVFIGDVGVGKSTVVEKLVDTRMDRGDSKLGVTRRSTVHRTYDGTVIVGDTPGSNSIEDQLQHNEEIAAAFNYRPISRVFVVVKADTRIAEVVWVVEKYSERFLSLPDDNIGVLVTHMDTVSWTPRDLKQRLTDEYGIQCVLFCGKETPREALMNEIIRWCGRTVSFRVDDRNFSELFRINDKMVKILKDTSNEIDEFIRMRAKLERNIKRHDASSNPKFARDFHSWLETQITEAGKRLAKSNNFTFNGEDAAKEMGYIANLTNQIRVVFNDCSTLEYATSSSTGR